MTDKQWKEYKAISSQLEAILSQCDTYEKRYQAFDAIESCYKRMIELEEEGDD